MALIERAVREKIVLVGVTIPPDSVEDTENSVDELSLLVDTAGADEVGRVYQRRQAPDPPTYVGKGKAEELREVALATDCDTVVFDNELTPAQQFNLEKLLGRTAIDRTAVILDIFAQNAHSQEGMAQVELAQLRYRLPRLRRRAGALSQQAGGMSAGGARIGTRGPGETQLEVDRRRIVRRIHKLEGELRDIERHRATQRKASRRSHLHRVVIVGYTNAGKSTLLNRLTDAGVGVADDHDPVEGADALGLALGRTVLGDVTQLVLQLVDAPHQPPPVDLELGLAGATGADAGTARRRHAAGLLGQRLAPAPQPGQPVAQEGELYLGLALLAVGVLGEDVEDHRGAVDRRAPQQLLEVELLGRRELVVEHHGVAVGGDGQLPQLLGLALADVGGRVGCLATLRDAPDLVGPRGVDEQAELVEGSIGLLDGLGRDRHADEDDLLPEGPFDE